MQMIFRNATVWKQNQMVKQDVAFENGMLHFSDSDTASVSSDGTVISDCLILPGFCDVHVHLREPGFCYKETIASGTAAAARGGYTAVCSMPNLNPVPDSVEHLNIQTEVIRRDACIAVYPYGALTVGELGEVGADLEGMAENAIAFSDDGRGVQSEEMMRSLMVRAKKLGKLVVAHCEDNSLLRGGYIHDGAYARANGHRGICSESEWGPIARDLKLAEETGCAYHVCHISVKESVALIRAAKARGVNVTCETAPHYLVMSDADLLENGRFKMNPPLRDESDRVALLEGILDGTIDMIATDHAPHSAEEKSRGLEKSAFGIVGLETAFPILYTELVKKGILTIERLVELLVINPRRRFGITSDEGFTVWNINKKYQIDPDRFASMGRATPFAGREVWGENLLTVYNGSVVYQSDMISEN
ncbi:MAG: dihydroorotase [Clostridia bacterium]|nr:dihydroorotase [Clostridia bacterium]